MSTNIKVSVLVWSSLTYHYIIMHCEKKYTILNANQYDTFVNFQNGEITEIWMD